MAHKKTRDLRLILKDIGPFTTNAATLQSAHGFSAHGSTDIYILPEVHWPTKRHMEWDW